MNMRKIVAVLAAVLMFCALLPAGVFAAPGDVALDANFDNGTNGFQCDGGIPTSNDGGYLNFNATCADWANAYSWENSIKADTNYLVTFKAKADKDCILQFKINNGWSGNLINNEVEVTTEWQNYEFEINTAGLTEGAIVTLQSNTEAVNGAIYNIDDLKIVEVVDSALIGKVINGDFSDNSGWALGNGASIANGMLTLNNVGAWSEAAMQTVPVKANTNYELTWKSQYVSGSGTTYMTLMDSTFANYTVTSGQIWMNGTDTNWINHVVTLNTGDHESIILKLTSEDGGTKTINIDDVKLTEIKDPSFDGILYNGDFETGKLGFGTNESNTLGAWINLWGSNSVELVDGYNSDYALKGTGGTWTQVYQPVAVEPNTDYIVTAWAKDASNSALWVKNSAGAGDITSKNFANGSDWQLNVMSFNSGSNNIVWIGLMSLAAGGTYTVDNVKVSKAAAVSNDGYINNGNFEAGSLNSWQLIWDSQVAASIVDDGHDSAFAAKVIGKAPWGQLRQQIAVEPNTDYKVTLWAKNINNMALLIKDSADQSNIVNAGINAEDEWTEITAEFNSGDNATVYVGVMVNDADSYGTFDDFKIEILACEHEYYNGCDTTCDLCGEERVAPHEFYYECDKYCICQEMENPTADHNVLHVEAKAAGSCIDFGNREYWYCEHCGTAWLDALLIRQTNLKSVMIAGDCISNAEFACQDGECVNCGLPYAADEAHTYDDEYDADCNVCGDIREVPERPVEVIYGDVNGDGEVDLVDAALLQQFLADWDVTLDEAAADVNCDDVVDLVDAALLQQFLADWDVTLGPVEG